MTRRHDPAFAESVMLRAGFKPLEPYKSALTKWKCLHLECGQIAYPKFSIIQSGVGGCLSCGYKKQGKTRITPHEVAVEIMLKSGLSPLEPFPGNDLPWKSLCLKCGKSPSPSLHHVKDGTGCGYCGGRIVDAEDAVALMIASGLEPCEEYPGALKRWKCIHLACGTVVYPMYAWIQSGRGGCIKCKPFGIDQGTPSYIYLITHPLMNAHKVGVGNYKKSGDRLKKFQRRGWQSFRTWDVKDGTEALLIEGKVFRVLRHDLKLPIFLSPLDMPVTGGFSETVDADSISLNSLAAIIEGFLMDEGIAFQSGLD